MKWSDHWRVHWAGLLLLAPSLCWMIVYVKDYRSQTVTLPGSVEEELDYQAWLGRQTKLKANIRRVCEQYGQSLKVDVDSQTFVDWIMFDRFNKILFCRNAKVGTS